MIGLLISGLVTAGYSLYSQAKANDAAEKAMEEHGIRREELERLSGIKIAPGDPIPMEALQYLPVTDEEMDVYAEMINAKVDEAAADKRLNTANTAAAAGYDPQEALAQVEPQIQQERERVLQEGLSRLKLEDIKRGREFDLNEKRRVRAHNIAEKQRIRDFNIAEELRVLENKMALAGRPTAKELKYSNRANRYSDITSAAGDFATDALVGYFSRAPQAPPSNDDSYEFSSNLNRSLFRNTEAPSYMRRNPVEEAYPRVDNFKERRLRLLGKRFDPRYRS